MLANSHRTNRFHALRLRVVLLLLHDKICAVRVRRQVRELVTVEALGGPVVQYRTQVFDNGHWGIGKLLHIDFFLAKPLKSLLSVGLQGGHLDRPVV